VVGRPLPESRPSRTQNSLLDKKIQSAKKKRRQVIVFVSEVSTGLNTVQYKKNKSYDLQGRGKSILRTEIVMEEFLDAIKKVCRKDASRPFLILRRHPKETSKELGKLNKEFDAISTTEDPIELVKQADLVVGMSSILLEDAYYAGCRVLCISPRAIEKTWLEITRKKMVFWTSRRESIVRYLKNTFRENCLKDNNSKQTRLKKPLNFTVPTIITILKKLAK
jgi:UDP-N-acetylglucosamine 2-epimerase